MGYRDLPCAIHNAAVDRQHDELHAEPSYPPREDAVDRVLHVLTCGEGSAFGHDLDALTESFLNLAPRDLGRLIASVIDPELFPPTAFHQQFRKRAHDMANQMETL